MRIMKNSQLVRSFLLLLSAMASLTLLPQMALAEGDTTASGDDTTESTDDTAESTDDATAGADGEPASAAAESPTSTQSDETAEPTETPAGEPAPDAASTTTEETAAPVPGKLIPPVVGYNKGFFLASPDGAFRLAINGRVQARFTFENTAGEPRANAAQFSIPRARVGLSGHAFDKRVTFALQMDFGKGGASLKDALVDFNIIDQKLMVQVGQFKRPFSRQQLASTSKQQFVDRAITDKHFGGGRDLGVMLHSHKKLPLEYAVGLFNGSGDKSQLTGNVSVDTSTGEGKIQSGRFSNVPDLMDPMVVARFGWHTKGFDGYRESDHTNSDFGIGIGGGVVLDFDSNDSDDSGIRAGLDYALAVRGLSSTGEVFVASAQNGGGFADQGFDSVGFRVQAGYTIKGLVEPAIRYARIMPAGGGGDRQELLGAVNVFFHEHHIKLSTDFGVLTEELDGVTLVDFRARSQVQLMF